LSSIDGHLALAVGEQRIEFAVAIRPALHDAHLGPLVHLRSQLAAHGERLLVCSRRIPERMGARLRELRIAYLDTAGAAWLEAPGLLVRVAARAPAKRVPSRARLTGTDLRLLHVLLRAGSTASSNHRQLAADAGIALGAVGKGLRALEARGLLRRRGAARWDIQDTVAAQSQFVEGWATVVRRRLHPRGYRASAPKWLERLPQRLPAIGDRCLRGEHATLHVAAGSYRDLAAELDLVPDEAGPITLLERFGRGDAFPDPERRRLWLAHPLLIHAELVAVGDERLAPAIEAIWRQWSEAGDA
jgi:hypothetical protein